MTLDSTEAAGIQAKPLVYAVYVYDSRVIIQKLAVGHSPRYCQKKQTICGSVLFLEACLTFMLSFPKVTSCGGDVQQRRSLEEERCGSTNRLGGVSFRKDTCKTSPLKCPSTFTSTIHKNT